MAALFCWSKDEAKHLNRNRQPKYRHDVSVLKTTQRPDHRTVPPPPDKNGFRPLGFSGRNKDRFLKKLNGFTNPVVFATRFSIRPH